MTSKQSKQQKYSAPACAYCPPKVRACSKGEEQERGPAFCPSRVSPDAVDAAWDMYQDPEVRKVAQASARVEAEGYCQWTRVEEAVQFAKKMGFTRIGIAMCISFVDVARVLSQVLESHGFEVVSAACKNGGVSKEDIGLLDEEKIQPGQFEAMCNPISQAQLLNEQGCEFNLVLGLCIGHDSLFFRHSKGLVSTLVAKDRVLAHNPIGALNLADSYFSRIWGPYRPEKPSKLPKHGPNS